MLIGYARVSTADQDLTLQTDALAKADRPGLAKALGIARAGDTLVIWKLDRLGRSTQSLIALAADLSARQIDFRSLTRLIREAWRIRPRSGSRALALGF